jgi:hypothetical protein
MLPLLHLTIDLILAGGMIYSAHLEFSGERAHGVAYIQEAGGEVPFNPQYDFPPPRGFSMIIANIPPIGVALALAFPGAAHQMSTKFIDSWWFLTNELACFAFWVLVGWLIDARLPGLWRYAVAYVGVRILAMATLALVHEEHGSVAIVLLFWASMIVWSLISLVRYSLNKPTLAQG